MQGKYINDPEILLQAAHKAGVSNPEMCINDESVDAVEVSSFCPLEKHMASCSLSQEHCLHEVAEPLLVESPD